ncbi:hypothetical protein [Caballeronia sp. LZ001]|uniref:hypothetical protein n=1 Tax=Caballeronia sp. LZ001 TaxID=3038553 RepID=UPI00285B3EC8|nr:hypothetical protein [Caballeronia sp. LZ001]MDR5804982.1 hypothetical protein [Caballeronia sp. LZ001]
MTPSNGFSLAKAMAISAAFPGGIGPLTIRSGDYVWKKLRGWDVGEPEAYNLAFSRLHLYDGGVYDNLGIEPLFDIGKQCIKKDDTLRDQLTYLLVSDGGAPLPRQTIPHPLNPFRFKRIADIALDQSRALRVRAFVSFLQQQPDSGAYLGIGADAQSSIRRFRSGKEAVAASLLAGKWLQAEQAREAAGYDTTLSKMPTAGFDLLALHGYETAKWNIELMEASVRPCADAESRS